MKTSYSWLLDYVETDWSPSTVAERLTMSGLEVEGIDQIGQSLEGVIIGRVLERKQHPNADRLSLCRVDVGRDVTLQIVCGAPNVDAGQLVPVATIGTTLSLPSRKEPGVFTSVAIKKSKIRDEYSEGMICAEDELGLTAEPRDGIMVLDAGARLGSSFSEYLRERGLDTSDSVIDISITPNRPDATSHIGVARDIAALSERALVQPPVSIPASGGDVVKRVSVQIESADACGRFVGMIVDGVTIAPSPAWLCRKLEAIGLRPRNNVVDVTNFVMHECGQPLHAYDLSTLAGSEIIVRKTTQPTKFTTLDDKVREIPVGTLMIRDGSRDIGIAGIMGGQNTEVSDRTTTVFIEAAYFDPSSIRKAAKKLGLQTDASYRFERGVDPDGQPYAAARAAALIADLGAGEIASGIIDENPVAFKPQSVTVRLSRITTILGVEIPANEVTRLLKAIGFVISKEDGDSITCSVPSFRPDIDREIDVIEEVARLYGYDRIPEPETTVIANFIPVERPYDTIRSRAMARLMGCGFREIYTNSILSGADAEYFNHAVLHGRSSGAVVHTANAISADMSALRPTMIASALPIVAHNLNHGQTSVLLADIGSVFNKSTDEETIIPGYREYEGLCLVSAGNWTRASFDRAARSGDFFDMKGAIVDLFSDLDLLITFQQGQTAPLCVYSQEILCNSEQIGTVGMLDADTANRFGGAEIFFAEIDWTRMVAFATGRLRRKYTPVSKFPVVDRDIAVLVDKGVLAGSLLETVNGAGGRLLLVSDIFDVYSGKGVPGGKKSVAVSLRFGSNRTLKDREVDNSIAKIVRALESTYGAELRK